MPLPMTGNVVPSTVTLLSSFTWEATSGGWGKLKGFTPFGAVRYYNMEVDALGRWMSRDGTGSGRHLTHTAATQAAITGGTLNLDGSGNPDGTFTDTSNALGGGAISYRINVDGPGNNAHAIPVAV